MIKFFLAAMLAVTGVAYAADPKGLETDWTWTSYGAKTNAASSTHTVQGVGFGYSIAAVGGEVTYTIHHTTKIVSGFPSISSTTLLYVPSGLSVASRFEAITSSPTIVIHGMSAATTAYIQINYGEKKR